MHTVLWMKDTPQFEVDHKDVMCDFIDKYVSCEIPMNESKLKELVLML